MGKLPNGPLYQLFNLVGGLAVAINVAAHHAVPSTIVNGIWAIVAVVVLIKMAKARRASAAGTVEHTQASLHTEPAATTAVLPIIGPALRDHESDATDEAVAATGLQAEAVPAPTAAAPMTESIPVITATIALALVAAAQQQHDDRAQAQPDGRAQAQHDDREQAQHDDREQAQHDDRPHAQHDRAEPHHADPSRA